MEGATVHKGQLLLVIDEEPYKIALQSALARQAEAAATLRKAEESQSARLPPPRPSSTARSWC